MKRISLLLVLLMTFLVGNAKRYEGFYLQEGIVYKVVNGKELKLDLFQTDSIRDGQKHPVLVYIHGGSWMHGNEKETQWGFPREMVLRLLKDGYSVVSVEYRLISENNGVRFPEPLSDCKDAVRWVRKMSSTYDFDTENIVTGGGSAGGHLALMTAYAPEEVAPGAADLQGYSSKIKAVVDIFGPTHIGKLLFAGLPRSVVSAMTILHSEDALKMREILLTAFTGESKSHPNRRHKKSLIYSPEHYVNTAVPTIFLHGDKDAIVPFAQSKRLCKKLNRKGIGTAFHTVKGDDHGFPRLTKEEGAQMCEEVREFLKKYVK